jgi:hypothetical protein
MLTSICGEREVPTIKWSGFSLLRSIATNADGSLSNRGILHHTFGSCSPSWRRLNECYPELVVHRTNGKVQSLPYLEFTSLPLNELQRLNHQLETKDAHLRAAARD